MGDPAHSRRQKANLRLMTRVGELSRILPDFSGVVLVTRKGQIVLREAAGIADAETGELLTPESVFQICSVSKQVTAAAVLALREDGVLDLHVPIARWITEAPASWTGITLHHLLSCTSGLGHWDVVPGFDVSHPLQPGDYLSQLVEQPLLFAPGSGWS